MVERREVGGGGLVDLKSLSDVDAVPGAEEGRDWVGGRDGELEGRG